MYYEEPKFKTDIGVVIALAVVALLFPAMALFLPIRPASESIHSWFQRSGSVMTIVCVLLDLKLFSMYGRLYPSGMVEIGFEEFRAKYFNIYRVLVVLALVLTASGTIIWGYGDLIARI